jgi:hypothetical protein
MRFEVVTAVLLRITVPSPSGSSKSRRFFLDMFDPEDEGTEILPHVRNYMASDVTSLKTRISTTNTTVK